MKVLIWNTEWRKPVSKAGQYIRQYAEKMGANVICYSEVHEGLHPEYGEVIYSEADYGYLNTEGRRKISLWSSASWKGVDTIGSERLPSGRFVTGVTQGIRFIAVCIPWRDAHVRTGRKDREAWQDHIEYLKGLKEIVEQYMGQSEPVCLLGDYNQRIPQVRQPKEVYEALRGVLDLGLHTATAGLLDNEGMQLIDHLSCSLSLSCKVVEIHPKVTSENLKLSDHVGIKAELIRL